MITITIIASVLLLCWFVLLFSANREDQLTAARGKLLANRTEIAKLKKKEAEAREKLKDYHGLAKVVMKKVLPVDQSKEINAMSKQNAEIRSGDLKSIWGLELPGYVILRIFPGLCAGGIYRKIRSCYYELYGKKHQDLLTRQLMAKIISYPILGTALSLVLGQIVMIAFDTMPGLAVMVVGPLLVCLLSYSQYDDLSDLVIARKDKIRRQVPNVLSKLALLVTSGMIMDRAWKETAMSSDDELYMEMRYTADEIANLVPPEVAYNGFIERCNTKETTKLASAIIQNLSKGNAEIAGLLQQMAKDSWHERRNLAKQDSENANSKLMVPTMMLFGAIVVMLLVPIAISMSSGL